MKNSNTLFKLFCLLPLLFAVVGYFFNIYFEKYLDHINLVGYCLGFITPTNRGMSSSEFSPIGAIILGFNWGIILLKASFDKTMLDDMKWFVPTYIILELIPLLAIPVLLVLIIIALIVKFFQLETE